MFIARLAVAHDGRDGGQHYSITVGDRSFDVWIRPAPYPDKRVNGELDEVMTDISTASAIHRLFGRLLAEVDG